MVNTAGRGPTTRAAARQSSPTGTCGCWIAKQLAQHTPSSRVSATKLAQHTPSSGISAKKLAQHATKCQFWAIFRALGELFRARTHHQTKQGELFRAQDPAHGDFETNDTSTATDSGQHETTITTARPQQGSLETGIASAPENCTENAHFAPAKAMAVSIEARPTPAKAMAVSIGARPAPAKATMVSTPHRCQQAKATPVSGERAAWSTGPRCDTRGRWRALAGRPVGGRRYKRRQTNTI